MSPAHSRATEATVLFAISRGLDPARVARALGLTAPQWARAERTAIESLRGNQRLARLRLLDRAPFGAEPILSTLGYDALNALASGPLAVSTPAESALGNAPVADIGNGTPVRVDGAIGRLARELAPGEWALLRTTGAAVKVAGQSATRAARGQDLAVAETVEMAGEWFIPVRRRAVGEGIKPVELDTERLTAERVTRALRQAAARLMTDEMINVAGVRRFAPRPFEHEWRATRRTAGVVGLRLRDTEPIDARREIARFSPSPKPPAPNGSGPRTIAGLVTAAVLGVGGAAPGGRGGAGGGGLGRRTPTAGGADDMAQSESLPGEEAVRIDNADHKRSSGTSPPSGERVQDTHYVSRRGWLNRGVAPTRGRPAGQVTDAPANRVRRRLARAGHAIGATAGSLLVFAVLVAPVFGAFGARAQTAPVPVAAIQTVSTPQPLAVQAPAAPAPAVVVPDPNDSRLGIIEPGDTVWQAEEDRLQLEEDARATAEGRAPVRVNDNARFQPEVARRVAIDEQINGRVDPAFPGQRFVFAEPLPAPSAPFAPPAPQPEPPQPSSPAPPSSPEPPPFQEERGGLAVDNALQRALLAVTVATIAATLSRRWTLARLDVKRDPLAPRAEDERQRRRNQRAAARTGLLEFVVVLTQFAGAQVPFLFPQLGALGAAIAWSAVAGMAFAGIFVEADKRGANRFVRAVVAAGLASLSFGLIGSPDPTSGDWASWFQGLGLLLTLGLTQQLAQDATLEWIAALLRGVYRRRLEDERATLVKVDLTGELELPVPLAQRLDLMAQFTRSAGADLYVMGRKLRNPLTSGPLAWIAAADWPGGSLWWQIAKFALIPVVLIPSIVVRDRREPRFPGDAEYRERYPSELRSSTLGAAAQRFAASEKLRERALAQARPLLEEPPEAFTLDNHVAEQTDLRRPRHLRQVEHGPDPVAAERAAANAAFERRQHTLAELHRLVSFGLAGAGAELAAAAQARHEEAASSAGGRRRRAELAARLIETAERALERDPGIALAMSQLDGAPADPVAAWNEAQQADRLAKREMLSRERDLHEAELRHARAVRDSLPRRGSELTAGAAARVRETGPAHQRAHLPRAARRPTAAQGGRTAEDLRRRPAAATGQLARRPSRARGRQRGRGAARARRVRHRLSRAGARGGRRARGARYRDRQAEPTGAAARRPRRAAPGQPLPADGRRAAPRLGRHQRGDRDRRACGAWQDRRPALADAAPAARDRAQRGGREPTAARRREVRLPRTTRGGGRAGRRGGRAGRARPQGRPSRGAVPRARDDGGVARADGGLCPRRAPQRTQRPARRGAR